MAPSSSPSSSRSAPLEHLPPPDAAPLTSQHAVPPPSDEEAILPPHSLPLFDRACPFCAPRWRKLSPSTRYIIVRVTFRVCTLILVVVLLREYSASARAVGATYLDWVRGTGGLGLFVFILCATAFCALSPTGYLPAVLSGVTFPLSTAIPVSYGTVVVGAALNLALVRGLCLRSTWLRARCTRRAGTLSGLETALATSTFRMATLLRLPFLGNGVLNYLFAFSTTLKAAPLLGASVVGSAPGAVLFALLGGQAGSLLSIITNPSSASPTAIGVLVAVVVLCGAAIVGTLVITRRVLAKIKAEAVAAAAETGTAIEVESAADGRPSSPHVRSALGESDVGDASPPEKAGGNKPVVGGGAGAAPSSPGRLEVGVSGLDPRDLEGRSR